MNPNEPNVLKKPRQSETRKNIVRRAIQVLVWMIAVAVILFVTSGKFTWIYAWLYVAASVLVLGVNASLMPTELMSERGRKKENVEQWDSVVTTLITITWFAIYVVAGLDNRFRWSLPLAFWIHAAGLAGFLFGNAIVTWSMLSNVYFSTAVRIQYDRGHAVASGGAYRFVRHPGYLGMIIYHLATPIFLGSIWALIPAGLTATLFIVRTTFEDTTLRNKLEGYGDYAQKVKYRLVPGLW